MFSFVELEKIAAGGGYVPPAGRDLSRITVTNVHQVNAALLKASDPAANQAAADASRLRRWLINDDGRPPPVRGAGFLTSTREVWIAYAMHSEAALVRGRATALAELRSYLAMAINPDNDGSLRVKTTPPVSIESGKDRIVLRSPLGAMAMSMRSALHIERWISATMRPKDRRGVLCLPGPWQGGPAQ